MKYQNEKNTMSEQERAAAWKAWDEADTKMRCVMDHWIYAHQELARAEFWA